MTGKLCPRCNIPTVLKDELWCCSSCGRAWENPPDWTCPVCGHEYYTAGGGAMGLCPHCEDLKLQAQKEYWAKEQASMRSIAGDIIKKALNGGK